jgi:hypothetical protein
VKVGVILIVVVRLEDTEDKPAGVPAEPVIETPLGDRLDPEAIEEPGADTPAGDVLGDVNAVPLLADVKLDTIDELGELDWTIPEVVDDRPAFVRIEPYPGTDAPVTLD